MFETSDVVIVWIILSLTFSQLRKTVKIVN